jgi:hypothetical protein
MAFGVYEYSGGAIVEKNFTSIEYCNHSSAFDLVNGDQLYSRILAIDSANLDADPALEIFGTGRMRKVSCNGNRHSCDFDSTLLSNSFVTGVFDIDANGYVTEKYLHSREIDPDGEYQEAVTVDLYGSSIIELIAGTGMKATCNGDFSTCSATSDRNWFFGVYNYSDTDNMINEVQYLTHDFNNENDVLTSFTVGNFDADANEEIVAVGYSTNGGQRDWSLGFFTWSYV